MAWKIQHVTLNTQTFTPVTVPAGMNMVRLYKPVIISDSGDLSKPSIEIWQGTNYQIPQDFPVEEGQVIYLRATVYEEYDLLFFRAPQPAGFTGTLDISSK